MEVVIASCVGAAGVIVSTYMGIRLKREVATSNGKTVGQLVEQLDDRTGKLEAAIITHLYKHLQDDSRHHDRRRDLP